MKEKPIMFADDMVRAILAGEKTQTRRSPKSWDANPWVSTPHHRRRNET